MTDVAFYNGLKLGAAAQILTKGQKMFYRRVTLSDEDPIKGTSDAFGPPIEIDGAVTPISHREIQNTGLSADMKRILTVLDFTPEPQDTITFGGSVHVVNSWDEVSPGGIAVLYKIMVS